MIPVPIPDEFVLPGSARVVIGPPDGDPTGEVRPVETVFVPKVGHFVRISVSEEELVDMAETGHFWLLICASQMPVFGFETEGQMREIYL